MDKNIKNQARLNLIKTGQIYVKIGVNLALISAARLIKGATWGLVLSADRPFVFFGFVLQYLAQDLASACDIALSYGIFYAHRILEV